MRRTLLGAVLALSLLAAFAVGVKAQDTIFAFRAAAYTDITLAPAPCLMQGPASMTVYDTNAWIVYTCSDNRVVLRRYLNPADRQIAPKPVYLVDSPTTAPPMNPACVAIGMVTGIHGGCVPANHPDAPKGGGH